MLAEGSIAVLQTSLILHIVVKLVDFLSELLLVIVHMEGTCGWVKLFETERIKNDLGCALHIY